MTPEQEAAADAGHWFWSAVREANHHAGAVADMSAEERARDQGRVEHEPS